MGQRVRVRCPLCGATQKHVRFGIDPDTGAHELVSHRFELEVHTYGGRGRIVVSHEPLPLPVAVALADALEAALLRLREEIRAAA